MSKIVAIIDLGYVNVYMTDDTGVPDMFESLKVGFYSRKPTDKVKVWPREIYGKKSPIYSVDIVRGVKQAEVATFNVHKVYIRAHGKLETITKGVY